MVCSLTRADTFNILLSGHDSLSLDQNTPMSQIRTFIFIPVSIILCLLLQPSALSQELNVSVTINHQNIPSQFREDLDSDFQDKVLEYMNRRWTQEDFGGEQIPVELTFFFQSATPNYQYSVQLFVGSSRPIYNQDRNTIVNRLMDENWIFTLTPGRPLTFDEYSYDPLTTVLDYYAYLIIGLDFDTYEPYAGTPYLERAADMARIAQRSGGAGWEGTTGRYSRLGYVEELLSSRNLKYREAVFHYHYNGLDLLALDQHRGLESIVESIEILGEIKRTDPQNVPVRIFFETKNREIAEILLDYSDRSVYDRLSMIDPANRATYEEYRRK